MLTISQKSHKVEAYAHKDNH